MKNNNYPTWLVSLEIAKKLKEIGFKEKCLCYWHEYFHRIECSTDDEDRLCPEYYDYNTDESTTSLPTWEQVFQWFRSKGYHGTLHTYSVMMNNVEEFRFYYEINSCQEYITNPEEYYKTYEQAQEALVYKLIETYKSEQK